VFDTETSGLYVPLKDRYKLPNYKYLNNYNSCRILSISWILAQGKKQLSSSYFLVKPDGFHISEESIKVHGITKEVAMKGYDRSYVFNALYKDLQEADILVAHNLDFDLNTLSSELYRYRQNATLNTLQSKPRFCTMKEGKVLMKSLKFPKLEALYSFLYNEQLENAHNALYDAQYCYSCYLGIQERNKD
jgi:DNA polymerase III epsilon subunit-like protein